MSATDGASGTVRARTISPFAAVSAAVYAVGGFGLLGNAVFHAEGMNPRWLLAALATIAFCFAVLALLRGRSFTTAEAEVLLVVCMTVIVALTLGTGIDVAALGNGAAMPLLAIYAGWFLSWRGRLILAAGALGWLAAVAAHGEATLTSIALSIVAESLIAAEVVRRLVQRMVTLAERDPLTGVLNRHGLEQAWCRLEAATQRRGSALSVAVIDVDGLREVNNRYGHGAGDALLVTAAAQWRAQLPAPAVVARVGGDEFVLLLPGLRRDAATRLLDSIAAATPARWSAGITELLPGESLDQVMARADQFMYNRKGSNDAAANEGVIP